MLLTFLRSTASQCRNREAPVRRQTAQPHLEDGTTYHPRRPTKLDKIENLRIAVRSSILIPCGLLL